MAIKPLFSTKTFEICPAFVARLPLAKHSGIQPDSTSQQKDSAWKGQKENTKTNQGGQGMQSWSANHLGKFSQILIY